VANGNRRKNTTFRLKNEEVKTEADKDLLDHPIMPQIIIEFCLVALHLVILR
jgi:hypothetical protein